MKSMWTAYGVIFVSLCAVTLEWWTNTSSQPITDELAVTVVLPAENLSLHFNTEHSADTISSKNQIWLAEREERGAKLKKTNKSLLPVRLHLLNSVARTEMLCQAFSSLSSSLRVYTDPLPAWMLNTLSMSVRRSIVYLQNMHTHTHTQRDQLLKRGHVVLWRLPSHSESFSGVNGHVCWWLNWHQGWLEGFQQAGGAQNNSR